MVSVTNHSTSSSMMNLYAQHREKANSKRDLAALKSADNSDAQFSGMEVSEESSPVSLVQRVVDSVDEMAVLLARLRRRDQERKSGVDGETSFERVLDDDVLPKVEKLLDFVKSSQSKSLMQLFAQLRHLFPDASDLVLVLRELIAKKKLTEDVKARLSQLLHEAESQIDPKQLRAGINIALKARLAGKKLGLQPNLLRSTYRKFQESEEEAIGDYLSWIDFYGAERRTIILTFMEGALLTDIDANDPSCSITEFGYLLKKLSNIKLLRSAEAMFINKLLTNDIVMLYNSDETEWLIFLFLILESPLHLDDALYEIIGNRAYLERHADRAILLQHIYQASRSLPIELFKSKDDNSALFERFKMLNEVVYRQEKIERRRSI